jgi:hypothetical protein
MPLPVVLACVCSARLLRSVCDEGLERISTREGENKCGQRQQRKWERGIELVKG